MMKINSPSKLRCPAEWEPHEATWLSWPNLDGESFEFGLEVIRESMLEIVKALVPGEKVFINLNDPQEQAWLTSRLTASELNEVRFFEVPYREPYLRDNGPTFVLNQGGGNLIGVSWEFDGWSGKYPPHDIDNGTAAAMCAEGGIPIVDAGIVFEGGAFESNGKGTLMISEPCFFARNPNFSKDEAEKKFRELLGATTIHWLPCPSPPGDDTDGHIDVTTRFAGEKTVLVSDIRGYADIVRSLGYDVVLLPRAQTGWHEMRGIDTPASYANFYIGNQVVLVPVFGQRSDAEACEIISDVFPDRKVVPINAYEIIKGQGGIHCLTQTVPQTVSL